MRAMVHVSLSLIKLAKVLPTQIGLMKVRQNLLQLTDKPQLNIQLYIIFSPQLTHSISTISALVNLIYVCAASVQPDFNSLALNISGFNLDYYSDRDVIGDLRVFAAAQKFQRVQKLAQAEASTMAIVHNVPEYDLNAIQDLTDVMHDSLAEYSKADTIQQEQIRSK